MHWNFAFNTPQVIWMLTFAAQLVLLVVLLGRDRARLFPLFTLCTVLVTFRWLASRLLFQRLSPVAGNIVFLSLAVLVALANLALVAEVALKAFHNASRKAKLLGGIVTVAIAVALVVVWGPWPGWQTFTGSGLLVALRLMQLIAQRGDMLTSALAVELAVLVALVGRSLGAGWRTHRQLLLVGVGTLGAGQLAITAIWQAIATHTVPRTQDEYFHLLGLRDKLNSANSALYIVVLIWWIACLWIDEPGTAPAAAEPTESAAPAAETTAKPAVE